VKLMSDNACGMKTGVRLIGERYEEESGKKKAVGEDQGSKEPPYCSCQIIPFDNKNRGFCLFSLPTGICVFRDPIL